MAFFKYFFFRLYTWNLNKWGKNDIPQWNAVLGLSFLMSLNIGAIIAVMDITGVEILNKKTPKIYVAIVYISTVIFNYYWILRGGKYLMLINKFRNELRKDRIRKTIIIWAYVFFSFAILIFLALIQ